MTRYRSLFLCAVISCTLASCARTTRRDVRLVSPNGAHEARAVVASREFVTEIEELRLVTSGVLVREIGAGEPPLDKANAVLAVSDDGSLYLGRLSGHLQQLGEVFVYRAGTLKRLGGAPPVSQLRDAYSGDARWWERWEASRGGQE